MGFWTVENRILESIENVVMKFFLCVLKTQKVHHHNYQPFKLNLNTTSISPDHKKNTPHCAQTNSLTQRTLIVTAFIL